MKIACLVAFIMLFMNCHSQFGYKLINDAFGINKVASVICGPIDSCFTITPDEFNRSGAVWDNKPINLSNNFDATFCAMLGSDNDGADGFAFVLRGQNSDSLGELGRGIGYAGITPSVAIEFDTYENSDVFVDDLPEDHTGMYINSDYLNAAVSSVPLKIFGGDVEDGGYHTSRIVWNATAKTLKMYFDGVLRLNYQGDLINNVFGGAKFVIWGFTASTGGAKNLQQICFPKYEIELSDKEICAGDSVALHFYDPNLTSYKWIDPKGNLIKNWNTIDFTTPFNLNDTIFYVQDSGYYYLNIEINNQVVKDSLHIKINPLPTKPLSDFPITFCPTFDVVVLDAQNPSCSYKWSTLDSTQTISPSEAGTYWIDLTDTVSSCFNTDTITLFALCKTTIVAPNIFTPNADFKNDVYQLIFSADIAWISDFKFEIINRWGQLIYSVENDYVHWDGTSQGKEVKDGVYFYNLSYKDKTLGDSHAEQGTIQVIR